MSTARGNFIAGGNPGDVALPTPPPDRTPEEIAAWRARMEAKSSAHAPHRGIADAARTATYGAETGQPRDPAPAPAVAAPVPAPPKPAPPAAQPAPADEVDLKVRNAAIVAAHAQGVSAKDLAAQYGVTDTRIRQILRKAGVELEDGRRRNRAPKPRARKPRPQPRDVEVTITADATKLAPTVADVAAKLEPPRLVARFRSIVGDDRARAFIKSIPATRMADGWAQVPTSPVIVARLEDQSPLFTATLRAHRPRKEPVA